MSIGNLFFYMVDNKIKYGKVMNTRKIYWLQMQNIMLTINNS